MFNRYISLNRMSRCLLCADSAARWRRWGSLCQESLGESILLGTLGIIWLRGTLIHAPPPPHRSPYWPLVTRPALLDPALVTENCSTLGRPEISVNILPRVTRKEWHIRCVCVQLWCVMGPSTHLSSVCRQRCHPGLCSVSGWGVEVEGAAQWDQRAAAAGGRTK